MVMIPDGQKFVGPVELVQHHSHNLDGLLVKPTLPCELGPTDKRFAYMGVSYLELERLLLKKAKSMKLEVRIFSIQKPKCLVTFTNWASL